MRMVLFAHSNNTRRHQPRREDSVFPTSFAPRGPPVIASIARRKARDEPAPVSQSVRYFTVPPRAHPSNGSQSGSATRSNTSTEYSLPGATQLSRVRSISPSGHRVFPAAFARSRALSAKHTPTSPGEACAGGAHGGDEPACASYPWYLRLFLSFPDPVQSHSDSRSSSSSKKHEASNI